MTGLERYILLGGRIKLFASIIRPTTYFSTLGRGDAEVPWQ